MAGNSSGDVIVKIDHVEKIYQGRSGEVVAFGSFVLILNRKD